MKNLHLSFEESYVGRLRAKVGNDLLVLPGANVFIENQDGKILMHQQYVTNNWRLIGGIAEDNESLWQTATREAKEEANLDLYNLKHIIYKDNPEHITTFNNGNKILSHTMSFYCKDYGGELKISEQEDDVKDLDWFDPADLNVKMSSRNRLFLDAFLEWKKTDKFQYITNKRCCKI